MARAPQTETEWNDLEQGIEAPRRAASTAGSGIVDHARTLLAVLTTLGTFGASLSFSTLNSGAASSSRTLLAWSFAAFILGSAETLIFQVALVADFYSRSAHRAHRSETGILTGMGVGFAAVLAGTLCLTLSMTASPLAGVRVAGYAVSFVLALIVAGSLGRLAYTIGRRIIHSAGTHGLASIAMRTPLPASVATVNEVPAGRGWESASERHSPHHGSCQGGSRMRDTDSVVRDDPSSGSPLGGCAVDERAARDATGSATSDGAGSREESPSASSSIGTSLTEDAAGESHPALLAEDCLPDDRACADNVAPEPAPSAGRDEADLWTHVAQ